MSKPFDYANFTARNSGYVSSAEQARIRQTRLLIAGCGIGSSTAICAARMGFERFVLVDGDVVDANNLNRQFYEQTDVGRPKVDALRDQILRINPTAHVEAIYEYLNSDNIDKIVEKSDIVFDTVDFLDLQAIISLHTAARAAWRPILTALSVGFGALVWFFPPDSPTGLTDILAGDMQSAQFSAPESRYAEVFASFVKRLSPYLDENVVEQISRVLTLMRDGKPCPASQVSVGSFAIAAMATSMIHDYLSGNEISQTPELIIHSFKSRQTTIVDLLHS